MNVKLLKLSITKLFIFIISIGASSLTAQNALDFDGTDDRVSCGADTSIGFGGKYITLEAWIYNTAFKTNAYDGNIINKEYNTSNYGYMLRCGAGGKLNFGLGDGSWHEITTVATVLSLNTWHHVAGTYDGKKMRLYLDGTLIDSLTWAGSFVNNNTVNLTIGDHSGAYSRRFQGKIDEVRVWASCRTLAEIRNNRYAEFCVGGTPNLRAYYKFNHGVANGNTNSAVKTLTDYSGFKNHGTLQNFTLSGTGSNWVPGYAMTKSMSYGSMSITRCDRYFSPSGKFKWYASGTYKDTIPSFMGCDSTITISLTINKKSTKTITAFACQSYTSPSGGYTWTKSGTYTDYLVNWLGCDSVLTIKLKIGGTPDSIYVKDCHSVVSPSKKYTYTASGVYKDTIKDYRGCDSIISVFFTKLPTTYSQIYEANCKSMMSPSGKYKYTKTGIYYDTLVNFAGCDSIIKVNFHNTTGYRKMAVTTCEYYKSPSKKRTWTTSGTYYDTLRNYVFCDSIIEINLTVNYAERDTLAVSGCRYYQIPKSGKYVYATGYYSDTFARKGKCDSIVTYNVTVIHVNRQIIHDGSLLTASSTTGSNFQWYYCDRNMLPIDSATKRSYIAKSNESYAVSLTESGCSDTSDCVTVINAGVKKAPVSSTVLFPNPNYGICELFSQSLMGATVTIYNATGVKVLETKATEKSLLINSSTYAEGIYQINIRRGTSIENLTMVVQH